MKQKKIKKPHPNKELLDEWKLNYLMVMIDCLNNKTDCPYVLKEEYRSIFSGGKFEWGDTEINLQKSLRKFLASKKAALALAKWGQVHTLDLSSLTKYYDEAELLLKAVESLNIEDSLPRFKKRMKMILDFEVYKILVKLKNDTSSLNSLYDFLTTKRVPNIVLNELFDNSGANFLQNLTTTRDNFENDWSRTLRRDLKNKLYKFFKEVRASETDLNLLSDESKLELKWSPIFLQTINGPSYFLKEPLKTKLWNGTYAHNSKKVFDRKKVLGILSPYLL